MIVSCPQCETRYELDQKVLAPLGRSVRCAQCSHVWTQRPGDDAGLAGDADDDFDIPDFGLDEEDEAPRRRRAARRSKPEPKGRGGLIGWAAFAAVIIGIAAGGFFGRAQIVDFWPPAAKLYAMAGIAAEVAAPGLLVQNVQGSQRREADDIVLDVTGEIVNASQDTKSIPELRGLLLDVRQRVVHSWTFQPPSPVINPGETMEFTTSVSNPPPNARGLQVIVVEG